MKMKKILCALIIILGMVGCDNTSSSGNGEPQEYVNKYSTKADRFDISLDSENWYISSWQDLQTSYSNGELTTKYHKSGDSGYADIYANIEGKFADFSYINIKAKAETKGDTNITIGLYNDNAKKEEEFDSFGNLMGSDVNLTLSDEYSYYTLKIKGTYRYRIDLAKAISITPNKGITDDSESSFTIAELFFSTTIPEGYEWKNTGVDSGEDEGISVYNWSTFTWTGYSLLPNKEKEASLIVNAAPGDEAGRCAEYAYLERKIEVNELDNVLKFAFVNQTRNGKPNSITRITFFLRGDVKERVTPPDGYAYNLYYEAKIYNYRYGDQNEVLEDENGVINLHIPIQSALSELKDHSEDGLRLTLLVESDPSERGIRDENTKYNYDGNGAMDIKEVSTYNNSNITATTWRTETWTNYSIVSSIDNKTTVSFTSLGGEYAYIESPIEISEGATTIDFVFEDLPYNNTSPSIQNIAFVLRGDISEHVDADPSNGIPYEYDLYHEHTLFEYDVRNNETIETNKEVTVSMDIQEALTVIGENHTGGYRLVVMIESKPTLDNSDGIGQMNIVSFEVK